MHSMTTLVKNQNWGPSISSWRVVSSKMGEIGGMKGWRLNLFIDDESYRYVRAASFRLYYRFSTVVIRPNRPAAIRGNRAATLQNKDANKPTVSGAGPEVLGMRVDEVSEQPCGSWTEKAVPSATTGVPKGGRVDELPSTQELLEGLGDPMDSSTGDGGEEDLPFLEPIL
ncbi:PREDICTED: uncharacterized protein LOC108972082 [Bactrocera latifrons]|uniref:uncharacterized protein LOC108972082 n=1 Tax=Bactrocera latifrons TaxID=174628 RepID=UPI0008DD5D51|nr:PREDICTED: uncharacterized protein LOC108972082 [Bactrocera latifrons]